ncbi:MAG: single-stranded-DNA-specific exonuclease RecJ [Bacillota bacterium]
MVKKRWKSNKKINTDKIAKLTNELDISFLTAKILISRGYDTVKKAKKFVYPDIKDLYDPFLFSNMQKVIDRINKAINKNEKIWIFGDYDVDGISAISILVNYFKSIDYPVEYYIPDRKKEGYGLSKEGIDQIFNKQGNLIITVDCGITAVDLVDYINSLKMDVIITDHHKCGDKLPEAFSIINPKVKSDNYPYDMICGASIAFKIVQAMSNVEQKKWYKDYIEIAAFATIADIVPLVDENRIITKKGLESLKKPVNTGLNALIENSDLKNKEITSGIVGYRLAPQINACGRLADPYLGVRLLTTNDEKEALKLASKLSDLNNQRQMIEKAIFLKSKQYISKNINLDNTPLILVIGEGFHEGVIGIVASRIVEKYNKPAIVLSKNEKNIKGSARSIGNLNMFELLKRNSKFFKNFGGHKMAAGLTLKKGVFKEFTKTINEDIIKNINPDDLTPILHYDGIIENKDILIKKIDELNILKPFGIKNPKPKFIYKEANVINKKLVGKKNSHLKMLLSKNDFTIDAIGFNFADYNKIIKTNQKINLVIQLDINEYMDMKNPQFIIKDIKISDTNNKKVNKKANKSTKNMKDKYIKTLFKSLKENSLYFLQIDFDKISFKKDSLKSDKNDKLILINSLDSINQLSENKFADWNINFNTIENNSKKDILINPILKNVNIKKYDQIIFYDIPIRNKNTKLCNFLNKNRLKNILNIFKNIPNKKELIKIYKYIKTKNKNLDINRLKKQVNVNEIKLLFCLELLKEIKIIDFKIDSNNLEIKILPLNGKKMDINENELYIKLKKLKKKGMDYEFRR